MSNRSNRSNKQGCSQPIAINSVNKKNDYNARTLFSIAVYALLIGSASAALIGCQSNPSAQRLGSNGAMIDFENADSAQNQAQGRAFTASLNANASQYQQLFDDNKYANSESQAKLRLLKAIRQHLATDHVAVTQSNYHSVPFTSADSIDAGSNSLLKTVIELYAFRQSEDYGKYNDYDYDSNDDDSYDDEHSESSEDELATDTTDAQTAVDAAVAEIDAEENKPFTVAYSANGYDYDDNGYDEYGYDEDGYDAYGYDYDGYDQDGYDEDGYDQDGYDVYGYDINGDDEYGDNKDTDRNGGGIFSILSNLDPQRALIDYEAMQVAKAKRAASGEKDEDPYSGAANMMLAMFSKTPEQVEAMNLYQYQNLTFNSVSQYKPKQRQFQVVYSYDYASPTINSSVQIPMAFDFDNSRMTLDPSAIMPIVAILNPKHVPFPNQMTSHTVDFGLPEKITSQVPAAVIYDAVLSALQDSMAELAPEHFSAVDIRDDGFAKEVGANTAVKVYFSSKQGGEMIGKMFKHISKSLEDYVTANPDKYADDAELKTAITKIQMYNKGYQSKDVGAFLQLIEAIGGISFSQVNYYYLDNSDRLLAKQQRTSFGADLMGAQTTVLNQVRYDRKSFNNSVLTPLLTESFGVKAKPAIDGNEWLKNQRSAADRLEQASYARYEYSENSVEAEEVEVVDTSD